MAVAVAYTGVIANGSTFAAGSGSNQFDITKEEICIDCQLTLSGSYGTASSHGDPVNLAVPPLGALPYGNAPTMWELRELVPAGTALTGFTFNYCPGPTLAAPTQAGGVLQITGGAASSGQGGVEITEGSAYSSYTPSLNGTVILARFWFSRSGT